MSYHASSLDQMEREYSDALQSIVKLGEVASRLTPTADWPLSYKTHESAQMVCEKAEKWL